MKEGDFKYTPCPLCGKSIYTGIVKYDNILYYQYPVHWSHYAYEECSPGIEKVEPEN